VKRQKRAKIEVRIAARSVPDAFTRVKAQAHSAIDIFEITVATSAIMHKQQQASVFTRFAYAATAGITHFEDIARSFGEHNGQCDPLASHRPITACHGGYLLWQDILSCLDAASLCAASASAPFLNYIVCAHADALWAQLIAAEFPSMRYALHKLTITLGSSGC
jgi:hypothetical protein